MFQQPFTRRKSAIGASAISIFLAFATAASAKESKRAVCTAAYGTYKAADASEKGGQWRDALSGFASCADATACGGLAPKCKARLDKLVSAMPSFIPVVTNEDGSPVLDVEVSVDGQLATSHLDGMALPVTPGSHDFTFRASKGVLATRTVLILEGQHNREIAVSTGSSNPAPSGPVAAGSAASSSAVTVQPASAKAVRDPSSAAASADQAADVHGSPVEPPPPVASGERTTGGWAMPKSMVPYVLGGVGVVGLVGGGLLTFWGNQDNSALESACSPTCHPAGLDHVKTLYVAADVSFGVGAAVLAVSTFLFATSRSTESAEMPRARKALVVDVQPAPSGAWASLSGAF